MGRMAFPELSHSPVPLREAEADALILALPPLPDAGDILADWPGLQAALEAVGFTGAAGATVRAYAPDATGTPLVVVGTGSDPDAATLRDAVGAAVRTTAPCADAWSA